MHHFIFFTPEVKQSLEIFTALKHENTSNAMYYFGFSMSYLKNGFFFNLQSELKAPLSSVFYDDRRLWIWEKRETNLGESIQGAWEFPHAIQLFLQQRIIHCQMNVAFYIILQDRF